MRNKLAKAIRQYVRAVNHGLSYTTYMQDKHGALRVAPGCFRYKYKGVKARILRAKRRGIQ